MKSPKDYDLRWPAGDAALPLQLSRPQRRVQVGRSGSTSVSWHFAGRNVLDIRCEGFAGKNAWLRLQQEWTAHVFASVEEKFHMDQVLVCELFERVQGQHYSRQVWMRSLLHSSKWYVVRREIWYGGFGSPVPIFSVRLCSRNLTWFIFLFVRIKRMRF